MKLAGYSFACASAAFALTFTFVLAGGCGSSKNASGFDDGDNANGDGGKIGDGGTGFGGGGHDEAGVDCAVSGTVSGIAYAPNGTLPLYNVIVFAPTAPLDPLADGMSCDKCGSVSGKPAATTVSDATGHFSLHGVPAGDNVPLVFQVGKWRRQVTIPHVNAGCADNPITDPNLSRLPKNHTEGDIPHMAITTGGYDKIACVLPKMGIDASEFGIQSDYATKRIILYRGATDSPYWPSPPAGITGAHNLWSDINELSKYDVAIFSCEGSEEINTGATNQNMKSPGDVDVITNYLNSGGRTFGADFMYTWIHQGKTSGAATPPSPIDNIMQGFVGGALGDPEGAGPYNIDTSFPKGQALSDWLQAVGGTTTPGKISLSTVFRNYLRVDPTLAQRWIYGDTADKAFSFNTPFSAAPADRCGKSYFLDIHVGDAADEATTAFPSACGPTLTPQEKTMVFFLFDLASCIQDDTQPVNPPR